MRKLSATTNNSRKDEKKPYYSYYYFGPYLKDKYYYLNKDLRPIS